MGEVHGTYDRFLKAGTALGLTYKIAETHLRFMQYAVPVPEKGKAFLYRYDGTGASSDANKPTGLPLAIIGSDLPEINIGRGSYGADVTLKRGFSMRIPHDIIREDPTGLSEIMRAYNTAGYWMAYIINNEWLVAAKAGAGSTSTFSPSAVWSSDEATPIKDLVAFQKDMRRAGYPYRLTDVFLEDTNFYELRQYLLGVDVEFLKMQNLMGVPTVDQDNIFVPTVGEVHAVISGLDEGAILGMDRNNPAVELHYYNDPKFSIPEVKYETIVGGAKQIVTAPNYGMHYNVYEEDKSHDTVMQFWFEGKFSVAESYGLLYASSGV